MSPHLSTSYDALSAMPVCSFDGAFTRGFDDGHHSPAKGLLRQPYGVGSVEDQRIELWSRQIPTCGLNCGRHHLSPVVSDARG